MINFSKKEISKLARPDKNYYQQIGGDEALKEILAKFYDLVFDDKELAEFFINSEKRTLREKQFSFLRRCFTGERALYMGQRPRNAHHYMTISNQQFNHRQDLMETCLREHGMSQEHMRKWLATEESFRAQIVKEKPIPLYVRGVATTWREDPEKIVLSLDSVCDRCHDEINQNSDAFIHGEDIICRNCNQLPQSNKKTKCPTANL